MKNSLIMLYTFSKVTFELRYKCYAAILKKNAVTYILFEVAYVEDCVSNI